MGRNGLSVVEDKGVQEEVEYAMRRHPSGKGAAYDFKALEDLKAEIASARSRELCDRLLKLHWEQREELEREVTALRAKQETEFAVFNYRIAGGTLEALGDLADDETITDAWAFLGGEFDL